MTTSSPTLSLALPITPSHKGTTLKTSINNSTRIKKCNILTILLQISIITRRRRWPVGVKSTLVRRLQGGLKEYLEVLGRIELVA
jgi:hypothetical protein